MHNSLLTLSRNAKHFSFGVSILADFSLLTFRDKNKGVVLSLSFTIFEYTMGSWMAKTGGFCL
jgi:hypothetical protein